MGTCPEVKVVLSLSGTPGKVYRVRVAKVLRFRSTFVGNKSLGRDGSTAMCRKTTFRSTTERIYDGGPIILYYNIIILTIVLGTAVAQWLRFCATNRKVAGSIPGGVIGIFH